MKITKDMLSDYQKNLTNKSVSTEKLILSLYDKENYYVDGKTLQFYIKKGYTLSNVHKVISYDQKCFLNEYVDMFSKMRAEYKDIGDTLNADMCKLSVNAVYGKTLQNTRKFKSIEILTSEQKHRFLKLSSKNLIKNINIFSEDAIAIEKCKTKVMLNQPLFMGQCILDRTKMYVYQIYYDILKKKYGNNVEIIYSDTDSLVLNIKCDDLYNDLKTEQSLINLFDFSEMKTKIFKEEKTINGVKKEVNIHPENHRKLGLLKDESHGYPIIKWLTLRSKMYAYQVQLNEDEEKKPLTFLNHLSNTFGSKKNKIEKMSNYSVISWWNKLKNKMITYKEKIDEEKIKTCKKSKGMLRNIVDEYKYKNYHDALYSNIIKTDIMNTIRSKHHEMEAITSIKQSLNPYDDKRFYINRLESVPHGYKKMP